jgi:hypothetical protein
MPIKDPVARAAWHKAYREANLERIKAVNKAYRESLGDTLKAKKRAYREANKEAINAKGREYWWENREVRVAQNTEWRANNKDYISEFNKEYRKQNLEKVKAKAKAWRNGPKRDEILKKKAEWGYASYRKDIEASRERSRAVALKQTKELTPSYVAVLLQMPRKVLTPELIEAKRMQMLIQRKLKEIKDETHQ